VCYRVVNTIVPAVLKDKISTQSW